MIDRCRRLVGTCVPVMLLKLALLSFPGNPRSHHSKAARPIVPHISPRPLSRSTTEVRPAECPRNRPTKTQLEQSSKPNRSKPNATRIAARRSVSFRRADRVSRQGKPALSRPLFRSINIDRLRPQCSINSAYFSWIFQPDRHSTICRLVPTIPQVARTKRSRFSASIVARNDSTYVDSRRPDTTRVRR